MLRRSWILLCLAPTLAGQDPVSLEQLAEIARQRHAAQRPAQLAALEPFLADLKMGYHVRSNRAYLDRRIQAAAELGDSVVPVLIEKLAPAHEGDRAARNVAENSARILLAMDPAGFVDPLIEVAKGENYTARGLALSLLGHTKSRAAARTIAALLDDLGGEQLITAVGSLELLHAGAAAPRVARYLRSADIGLRNAALSMLTTTATTNAVDPVLAAFENETSFEMLPGYLDYFRTAAPHNAAVASALLPLLHDNRLDRSQVTAVCEALGVIAPPRHQPTLDACEAVLKQEESGALGLACALAMRQLGDDGGVKRLLTNLNKQIHRNPRDDTAYGYKGDVYMALEKWSDAEQNYAKAINNSKSRSVRSYHYLRIARCEAHRDRLRGVLKALKDSGASHAAIQLEAANDPALAKALEQDAIERFMRDLRR